MNTILGDLLEAARSLAREHEDMDFQLQALYIGDLESPTENPKDTGPKRS